MIRRIQQGLSAEGITVSPLNAGHQIGGALWKITKESERLIEKVHVAPLPLHRRPVRLAAPLFALGPLLTTYSSLFAAGR